MRRTLPFIIALVLSLSVWTVENRNIGVAHAINTAQPQTNNYISSLSYTSTGVTFANLTTTPPQTNGTIVYCSDCQVATTCTGSGSGAMAKLVNGTWKCADNAIAGATSTPFALNGSPVPASASPESYLIAGPGGSPVWTATPQGAASASPFAVNGSPVPGTAAAGLILGAGPGGSPVWTASPGAALVNGSPIPATAAAGLQLIIGPGGTPTFTATPTAFAVNGSPVPGTAAAGLVLAAGAGGTPVWTATPGAGASKFLTFQFGNITAVPTASVIQDEHYVTTGGTLDHIVCTTTSFTCSGNPTVNIQDCGASVNSCGSPTNLGTTAIATASAIDVNVASSALTATHYVGLQWTGGTCTVLSGQCEVTYH